METCRYYFSPRPANKKTNEYENNFFETLSKKGNLVNYNAKPTSRSVDYLNFSFKSDVMILNWPEDVLHLRFGLLQLLLSCFTFTIFRLTGGKIVWVCHNKNTHKRKYKLLSKLTQKFYAFISNKIIVHSKDALDHFENFSNKVYYLGHPIYSRIDLPQTPTIKGTVDVLIWGTICPYKGLTEFVSFYKHHNCSFKVLIIGKGDNKYLKSLKANAKGLNIEIIGSFIEDELLEEYFRNSKIIALPYLSRDTFSSGALIHSLNSNKVVIGPRVGNFIDLDYHEACLTFKDRSELFSTITRLLNDDSYYERTVAHLKMGIDNYCNSNSWDKFIGELLNIVNPVQVHVDYKVPANLMVNPVT